MAPTSDALSAARTALKVATAPGNTEKDRRAFITALLPLPAEDAKEAKLFFVSMLPKFFAEFEDLQNDEVDRLLDLCEHDDEEIRILGIGGLGTVAKKDIRWVKGNVNVLLQLLESPPKELEAVKATLNVLLNFAPGETLDVILTDCAESEETTGIRRLNLLKYLSFDAADFRKERLQSGQFPKLEISFFDGLVGILDNTFLQETRIIIDMLSNLFILKGRNVDKKRLDRFVRALTTSLEAESSTGKTIPHVNAFAAVSEGQKELDGRAALIFLSYHGGAVVDLALAKKDNAARGLCKHLEGRRADAEKRWAAEADKEEKQIVRQLVDGMLYEVLRFAKGISTKDLVAQADTLEWILWPIYELVKERSRRDLIRSSLVDKLKDLGDAANKAYKEDKQSMTGRRLRNVRDLTDYLSSEKDSGPDGKPTWLEPLPLAIASRPVMPPPRGIAARPSALAVPAARAPIQAQQPRAAPIGGHRYSAAPAARAPAAPAGPSRTLSTAAQRDDRNVVRDQAPSGPSRSSGNARARSRSPARGEDRQKEKEEDVKSRRYSGEKHIRERSRTRSPSPLPSRSPSPRKGARVGWDSRRAQQTQPDALTHKDDTRQEPSREASPASARLVAPPSPARPVPQIQATPNSDAKHSVSTVTRDDSAAGPALSGKRPTSILGRAGSSRGIELLGPPSEQSGEVSSRGKELLGSRGVEWLPTPAASTSTGTAAPAAIADSANDLPKPPQPAQAAPFSIRNSSNKRARDDDLISQSARETAPQSKPASSIPLLARLSRPAGHEISDSESSKRARTSIGQASPPTQGTDSKPRATLLSRIGSSTPNSAQAASSSPAPAAKSSIGVSPAATASPGLSIRAHASAMPVKTPMKAPFSVLGRSAASASPALSASTAKTSSGSAVPATASVQQSSSSAVAVSSTAGDDDNKVRYKGRGFEKRELSSIVLGPGEGRAVPAWRPHPSPKQAQPTGGSLQARMGLGGRLGPVGSLAGRLGGRTQ